MTKAMINDAWSTDSDPRAPMTAPVTTTRVGEAGASARLVALALALTLAAVAWIGVSGRRGLGRELGLLAFVTAVGQDMFAVSATIGRRPFLGLLEEVSPGQLSGEFRVPSALSARVRFELLQLWTTDGPENYVPIDAWEVQLDGRSATAQNPRVLLAVQVGGSPYRTEEPRPVRYGYSFVMREESTPSFDVLTFDLKMPTR